MLHRASVSGVTKLSLSDVSDDELSWDSEIDGPESEEGSEGEEQPRGGDQYEELFGGRAGGPGGAHGRGGSEGKKGRRVWDEDDEFVRDPWNAVCVVGLRVYGKDTEVQIEVVRSGEEERRGRAEMGLGLGEKGLDVDDSAKDATKRLEEGVVGEVNGSGVGGVVRESEASRSG